jgi:predicted negative regulator of RcsB-dependent stress response
MATRFTYSTRDWFWLSVVLCLAIGWGTHFQYSRWNERHLTEWQSSSTTDEEFIRQIESERQKSAELDKDNVATIYALMKMLTPEQRQELDAIKEEWKKAHPTLPAYEF